ncbi:unnamed protein product [Sphagnum jensenii]|uniref:AAA+ ATPase domain-containing protein n=1 Tax=Sphagnum jensenii TaxID=128206 RepID=A0ABP1BAN6_9BRYO
MHDKEEQARTSRRKQQQEKEQKQANIRVMVGVDALAWTVEDKEPPASSAINVFVTGQPGVGKTSLVLNTVKKLPKDMIAGFYTLEARNPRTGEKVGLDIETLSGECAPLSRLRRGCGPKVGKYYFAMEAFERLVLPLLKPSEAIKLHVIDEVGRMELQSEHFKDALMALLASPNVAVFGSLPACRYGHDLPFVEAIKQRSDTAILTLTKSNRDATALQVEALLRNIVSSASVSSAPVNSPVEISSRGSSPEFTCSSFSPYIVSFKNNEEPPEKKRRTSDSKTT